MGVDHHRQRAFGVLRSIDPYVGASLGADIEDAVLAARGHEGNRHRLLGPGEHIASRFGREGVKGLCAGKAVDEGLCGRLELAHEVPPVLSDRSQPSPYNRTANGSDDEPLSHLLGAAQAEHWAHLRSTEASYQLAACMNDWQVRPSVRGCLVNGTIAPRKHAVFTFAISVLP